MAKKRTKKTAPPPPARQVCLMAIFEAPGDLTDERLVALLQRALNNGLDAADPDEEGNEDDADCKDLARLPVPLALKLGPPPRVYVEVAGGVVTAIHCNCMGVAAEVMDHDNADAEAEDAKGGDRDACNWLDEHRDELENIY